MNWVLKLEKCNPESSPAGLNIEFDEKHAATSDNRGASLETNSFLLPKWATPSSMTTELINNVKEKLSSKADEEKQGQPKKRKGKQDLTIIDILLCSIDCFFGKIPKVFHDGQERVHTILP